LPAAPIFPTPTATQVNRVANCYSRENIKCFPKETAPLKAAIISRFLLLFYNIDNGARLGGAPMFLELHYLIGNSVKVFRVLLGNFRGQYINSCSLVIHNSKMAIKSPVADGLEVNKSLPSQSDSEI
jgi:hypothetical protein